MAHRLVITCDQCPTETTNQEPHAHMGPSVVPDGWTEIVMVRSVPVVVPMPPGFVQPRASAEELAPLLESLSAEERAEVEAQIAAPPHRHMRTDSRRALLCPQCASALAMLVGDRELKLKRDPSFGPSTIGYAGSLIGR